MKTFFVATLGALGLTLAATVSVDARQLGAPGPNSDEYLESFALGDPENIRKLDNGEYLFRMGRDTRSGAVYWARMGNSKHVIVTMPNADAMLANEGSRRAVMTVAELRKGFGGCDWDGTHTAYVVIVPEDFAIERRLNARDSFTPMYGKGEITFNRYGRGPTVVHLVEEYLDLADY